MDIRRDIVARAVVAGLVLAACQSCGSVSPVPTDAQAAQIPEQTTRGDLTATERATIELFEDASPSVVYITTLSQRRNLFTGVATEVPRGTGTGIVWDRLVTFTLARPAVSTTTALVPHAPSSATRLGIVSAGVQITAKSGAIGKLGMSA